MSHNVTDTKILQEAAGGGDSRQWVSFGQVRPDAPDARSVLFKDANGQALPWPTVLVELHPSGIVVPCRVANDCAGVGEAEWNPFVAGDEVVVLLPEGNERAGCTIIGRLNQQKDAFPTDVAGQDPSTNTFAFKRVRAAYILESATALLFRNAKTKSFISIAQDGNITASEGSSNGFLHIGADFLALQTGDNTTLVQLDVANKQVLLQADTTQFILDAQKSQIMTKGMLRIATGGAAASGHAITLEQCIVLIQGILTAVGALIVPTPLTPAQIVTGMTTGIPAALLLPITPFSTAIAGGLQKPPDDSGTLPGIGRASLMI